MPPLYEPAERLSAAAARRIAVAAQGLAERRPSGRIDRRHLARALERVQLLQIDSVNVLARAHYLPLFSRLGPYPMELLDGAAWGHLTQRSLFEYWAHEASLLPVATQPLFRWRMQAAAAGEGIYGGLARFAREQPAMIERIHDEIADRGALAAGELLSQDIVRPKRGPGWWNWDDSKRALEFLFWSGRVTTATRRNFERRYDLPERVLPAELLGLPTPDAETAQRELVRLAARAHGVATERDLRDYFRLSPVEGKRAVATLVEAGALLPVAVEGWRDMAFLDPAARRPRSVTGAALLAPFDPLIWERARTERIFGFRYRIEIYVPQDRRIHGYYVLPFLWNGELVARVDLKADRAGNTLRVQSAHLEPGQPEAAVAAALHGELLEMAAWLQLEQLQIARSGNLAAALRRIG